MSQVLRVDPVRPDAAAIEAAAACLRQGGLVAFPTETVYGLGAHALDRPAVLRLFDAKGRPRHDPLIVHIASPASLGRLVRRVPASARALAARFWPGPLTLVLPRAPVVPDEVAAGLDTLGVRVPAHPVAQALLSRATVPVAAPSANLFSRPSPTTARHVLDDLGDVVDIVLDGGPTTVGVESSVVDLSGPVPRLLRPGAVTVEMLRELLPDLAVGPAAAGDALALPSPGLLEKHYSPRAPLTLYTGDPRSAVGALARAARAALERGQSVGILVGEDERDALGGFDAPGGRVLVSVPGPSTDAAAVARRLYASLRDLDAAGVDVILARAFPAEGGLGVAIADRLTRAAAGRVVTCEAGGAPDVTA